MRAIPALVVPQKGRTARDTGPPLKVRRLVYARCGAEPGWPGTCEWPGCTAARTDVQHRLARKAGSRFGAALMRINTAAWLLGSCRHHHLGVTDQYGEALLLIRVMGWVLQEHEDAHDVPVLTRHSPRPILLSDEGGWTSHVLTTHEGSG